MNPEVFTILTQFLYKIGEFIEILPFVLVIYKNIKVVHFSSLLFTNIFWSCLT